MDYSSYKKCETNRSPILLDMAGTAITFWDGKIKNKVRNNWLYLIEKNGFEIYTKYGCKAPNSYFNNLDAMNYVFVASKYVDGECKARKCIDKIDIFVDDLVMGLLFAENDGLEIDIVIVGNPDLLSFEMQYLLFRNVNVLLGVYNPIFSVAALLMQERSIIFETVMSDGLSVEHLAIMTNKKYHRMNEMVDTDIISNVDIEALVRGLMSFSVNEDKV